MLGIIIWAILIIFIVICVCPGFHNRFYSMLCDSSMWILSDVLDNRWL